MMWCGKYTLSIFSSGIKQGACHACLDRGQRIRSHCATLPLARLSHVILMYELTDYKVGCFLHLLAGVFCSLLSRSQFRQGVVLACVPKPQNIFKAANLQ